MNLVKMQLACLSVLVFIAANYFFENHQHKISFKGKLSFAELKRLRNHMTNFQQILRLGFLYIIFDILSVLTVNNPELIHSPVNYIVHWIFLSSLDMILYSLFIYIMKITGFYPANKTKKFFIWLPLVIGIIFVAIMTPNLKFITGNTTNYSMGGAAYTAFILAGLCIFSSIIIFARRFCYINAHKRILIIIFLFILLLTTTIQAIFPESLISSLGMTLTILAIYLNEDNPAMKKLSKFHKEMTNGFANVVENRDENTGGHIRRVTAYVSLLVDELRLRENYRNIMTSDWIDNIEKAAPMHDVGKISIPDSILQKPGKLTDEEYEIMKTHTTKGAELIKKSFKNLDNEDYTKMILDVALYHHEKWNGKGYPKGLSGYSIPLSARIMAVADVFDAISQKRCYRDAMPFNKCFEIISNGRGTDFDPEITDVFISLRPIIEQICTDFREE